MIIKARTLHKNIIVIGLMLVLCLALGFIFNDYMFLGSLILFLGAAQTLLLSKGVWWEELIGITEAAVVALVAYRANLFGTAILTIAIYIPLSIFSLISWKDNQQGGKIQVNRMTVKTSVIVVFSLIITITIVSLLLSLLPNQNLPVLDTLSNMLDICGIILIALRYKEGWIFWMLCSGIDLVLWGILHFSHASHNGIMMIIVSLFNILLNAWGFYCFLKMSKNFD